MLLIKSLINYFVWLYLATEIRCQEKSRGGLSYEVILAEPAPNVTVPKKPATPNKNISFEEIEQKLKAAEERRLVNWNRIDWSEVCIAVPKLN